MVPILQLRSHGSNLTEEELDSHTISGWKEAKSYMNRQINDGARTGPRQLVHVSADFSIPSYQLVISSLVVRNSVAFYNSLDVQVFVFLVIDRH